MFAQVILQGNGPLPLKGTFEVDSTDSATVFISASASATAPASSIGVQLALDGTVVGGAAVFSNEPGSHKALISPLTIVTLPSPGTHTVTLTAANGSTVSDANDFFTVTIIY
jgi:hypothetical protein